MKSTIKFLSAAQLSEICAKDDLVAAIVRQRACDIQRMFEAYRSMMRDVFAPLKPKTGPGHKTSLS